MVARYVAGISLLLALMVGWQHALVVGGVLLLAEAGLGAIVGLAGLGTRGGRCLGGLMLVCAVPSAWMGYTLTAFALGLLQR